ncbi:MAG: TIGR00645 family protein [Geminicoccaceae bacterium]
MIETAVERVIFMSRWIMAPIYLGLILVLGVLMVKFMEELYHFVPHVLELRETDVILMTLTLLDISLAASLVLMMIFSGYENFVSRIDTGDNDRPAWMGKLDFGGLKLKLVSSIVAISAIDLLKSFMNIGSISKEDLMWKVITHMAFVFSGLLLALMDYITEQAKKLAKA